MELQKIKQLIDVLAASDLAELELVEGEHRVRLVRRMGGTPASAPRFADVPTRADAAAAVPTTADSGRGSSADPLARDDLVFAPLYGVLHLTPAPDAPAFVRVGDTVQPGQTLCVVEAMKMFHEVKALRSATIAAILARAGDEVEAGAVLFRLAAAD